LNISKCLVNKDAENLDIFPDLDELTSLVARDLGIIWITDVGKKYPSLQTLDVSNNKIYSLKNLDELERIEMLVEVNMNQNPIHVHKGLDEMLQDAVPAIEVVNNK
jgi:Leucine-rich repeat (LRR) protein